MFLFDLFTTLIYQPFLNILLFFYWLLGLFTQGQPDMGIAVILLTLIIRGLLLPISLSGERTEEERREIARQLHELEEKYREDPQRFQRERKKVFRQKRSVLAGELFSLVIQVMIALMLWRMFGTGLKGGDYNLIYPFMPTIETPFNLEFLGRFDLGRPSLILNAILAFLIFAFETVSVLTSPYPPSRGEVVRLQLTLPIVSFLLFLRLPSGKLLFISVTMIVSIILAIVKYIRHRFLAYKAKMEEKEREKESESGGQSQTPVVQQM